MRRLRSIVSLSAIMALGMSGVVAGQATTSSGASTTAADSARAARITPRPTHAGQRQNRARRAERAKRQVHAQRQLRYQRQLRDQRARPGWSADRFMLRGITLDSAQRERVATVRQSFRASSVELRRKLSSNTQRADSLQRAAAQERLRGAREQATSLRQREASEIRGILTPDQQKTFDAIRQQRIERERARPVRPTTMQRGVRRGPTAPPRGARGAPDSAAGNK